MKFLFNLDGSGLSFEGLVLLREGVPTDAFGLGGIHFGLEGGETVDLEGAGVVQ